MAGQFIEEFFSNIDINDSFFDSLKNSIQEIIIVADL